LEEPTAVAFANGEITAAAKVFKDAMATVTTLSFKSGLLDNAYIDAKTVEALASIPSKEVLIAQLLGMLQSPISGLARALQQVAEKKA
jgi:large subunit ribosomal protein L10